MAKYIEAEALKQTWVGKTYPCIVCGAIEQAPAADVVEVVRCKDCVHCAVREYDIIDELECEFFDVFTDPLDYCSRGERKAE